MAETIPEGFKKEIAQVLLDNIGKLRTGLCLLSFDLYWNDLLTQEEHEYTKNFFIEPKPSHPSFPYQWNKGDIEIRKKWLRQQLQQS